MKKDNTVFVLQRAIKAHSLKVTKSSVAEFLLSHPRYPSLMSVCDGLKKWNIGHYPLKLSKQEILDLEPPYIAHLDMGAGQLALVKKKQDSEVNFLLNKKERIVFEKKPDSKVTFLLNQERFVKTLEEFSEILSGGVIVIDPAKKSGESGYRQNRQRELVKAAILPFIVIAIVLFGLYTLYSGTGFLIVQERIPILLFITKAIGITGSVFLVLHEFKVHTRIADKICGFSSGVDCVSVLASDISRIFGNINLADVGIVYFTSTFLYILGTAALNQLWLLAVVSAVSIVFPVYSIYYQGFRLKKWCPFCLVVQAALIAEFFILLPMLGLISISIVDLLRLAAFFSLVTSVWILYKSYYELSQDYISEHRSFLRFKSNPGIFRFLLQKNGYTDIPEDPGSLVFGNPDAPITVTAFLSINCNPCAGAFKEIKALIDNTDKVKICVILMVKHQEQKLAEHISHLYTTEGQEQAFEYLLRWYASTREGKNAILKPLPGEFPEIEKIANSNKEFFKQFKITGTPTIYVNGYKFPRQFKVSDIDYFTEEILSLAMESKGQEACSHCR